MGMQRAANLRLLLDRPSCSAFVTALSGLTHPELRLSDANKRIQAIAKQYEKCGGSDSAGKSAVLDRFGAEIAKMGLAREWPDVGSKIGTYNAKWTQRFAPTPFGKALSAASDASANRERAQLLTNANLLKEAVKYAKSEKENMRFLSGKVPLSEFSTWLSTFDHAAHNIEVPGQYVMSTDAREPRKENHSVIIAFSSSVLVMSSIRKPKRITILDSHGNEVMFLVKGGEDLRNDERIESLFERMNSFVSRSKQSVASSYSIASPSSSLGQQTAASSSASSSSSAGRPMSLAKTYRVVPMRTTVGILEWVPNTIPIKAVIEEEMSLDTKFMSSNADSYSPDSKSVQVQLTRASAQREDWLAHKTGGDYHKMFKSISKSVAVAQFERITTALPTDFLRRRLLRMSTSPESYLAMRSIFLRTLAASNVFGYILGIGDRHLDNLLLSKDDGSIVQIDFGVCFGIGLSLLPVPELIPFRLSPQLLGVAQPLPALRIFHAYMYDCLSALREESNSDSLANALDIYINDPVVDWLGGVAMDKDDVMRQAMSLSESASTETSTASAAASASAVWEPARRVRAAVRRLRGEHPAMIFVEELSQNAAVKREGTLAALQTILCSNRRHLSPASASASTSTASSAPASASSGGGKKRASAASSSSSTPDAAVSAPVRLSVDQQLDALIELATDPDILVRQWIGLQAWV